MHSQSVYDILVSLRKAHRNLIERAEAADYLSEDDRFHVVLAYVKKSEREIENILGNVDKDIKGSALKAWTRHYSDDPVVALNKIFKQAEVEDLERFIELLLEAKNKIIDLYDSCMNGLSNPEAQAIFKRLRDYECSQIENFSRRVNGVAEGY
ncbi:MAG: hypothetical protein ACOH5I_01215 [Oligoflexus sp.]